MSVCYSERRGRGGGGTNDDRTCPVYLCVKYPLLQNVVVTYGGMIFYQDYVYDPYNYVGINIRYMRRGQCLGVCLVNVCLCSVAGSLLYSYLKYRESRQEQEIPTPAKNTQTA